MTGLPRIEQQKGEVGNKTTAKVCQGAFDYSQYWEGRLDCGPEVEMRFVGRWQLKPSVPSGCFYYDDAFRVTSLVLRANKTCTAYNIANTEKSCVWGNGRAEKRILGISVDRNATSGAFSAFGPFLFISAEKVTWNDNCSMERQ